MTQNLRGESDVAHLTVALGALYAREDALLDPRCMAQRFTLRRGQ